MKRFDTYTTMPQAYADLSATLEWMRPEIEAGRAMHGTFGPARRSDRQSNLFHSLIGQISKHLGGDLADRDDAKRILLSAFKIDTRNDPDLVREWDVYDDMKLKRGLRGEIVLLGNQTHKLSKKLGSSFIEWLYAFGVEQGVVFKELA